MNKIILIALMGLSMAIACHPSCLCSPNSNVCNSCVVPGSTIDSHLRSCPCPDGQYTFSLAPFTCKQFVQIDGQGNDVSIYLEACALDIAQKTSHIIVNTYSELSVVANVNYISTLVSLDFSPVSLSVQCKQAFVTSLQYKDPVSSTYINLPAQYIVSNPALTPGAISIKIPLIDIYNMSATNTVNANNEISQLVQFNYRIGSLGNLVRVHQFNLYVYTNRREVQTFVADVSIQQTSGCIQAQGCIIVADLTTKAKVCTDATCNTVRGNNAYVIGDIFYAKISFVDPTYTKKLAFVSLYFLDAHNRVYNFSYYTSSTSSTSGIIISLPLISASAAASIQVTLTIVDPSLPILRRLQTDDPQTTKQSFNLSIESGDAQTVTSTDMTVADEISQATSNISFVIIFGIINMITLLLL